jgi:hypothetical protein
MSVVDNFKRSLGDLPYSSSMAELKSGSNPQQPVSVSVENYGCLDAIGRGCTGCLTFPFLLVASGALAAVALAGLTAAIAIAVVGALLSPMIVLLIPRLRVAFPPKVLGRFLLLETIIAVLGCGVFWLYAFGETQKKSCRTNSFGFETCNRIRAPEKEYLVDWALYIAIVVALLLVITWVFFAIMYRKRRIGSSPRRDDYDLLQPLWNWNDAREKQSEAFKLRKEERESRRRDGKGET